MQRIYLDGGRLQQFLEANVNVPLQGTLNLQIWKDFLLQDSQSESFDKFFIVETYGIMRFTGKFSC